MITRKKLQVIVKLSNAGTGLTRFSLLLVGKLDISHIGITSAVSAVTGFRFSEPSALAAGFGADDSTYSVIVKCQTIRGQRTSIGRTTSNQRPQLRDPRLAPAAHKAPVTICNNASPTSPPGVGRLPGCFE